ncbi:plasmid replication protein RepC [Acidimangrovimonas sediminis]|uniref:plasmid replication protein RepC n=1 Tax=Acidimangrovimonas sediminis TaxID=2056283 RepID=UPI000C8090E0|nr:plasmid replication protein RepC [Acidimangrovimonas sediminis]
MQHISQTPFGRSLRPTDLAHAPMRDAPLPDTARDKWAVMRDLTLARGAFAVSDRDLAVLNALVSFHPHPTLAEGDGSIVFPSNRALSERTHGMAESTLRRHLAALVAAGLVIRHDSPNGKRYARRGGDALQVAFGFDLRPLLLREAEIAQAAQAAREAEDRRRALREAIVLILRDVAQLAEFGCEAVPGNWDALMDARALMARDLRRKMDLSDLAALHARATDLREQANTLIQKGKSEKKSGNADESERHKQDSNKPLTESESSKEMEEAAGVAPDAETAEPPDGGTKLPLWLVLQACPDAREYSPDPIRNWTELIARAEFIAPMMGISPSAWREAAEHMGATNAAITVLAMLQRTEEIRNPGGYLRALTSKAAGGSFSPGPMIMALMQARNSKAV